VRRGQEKNISIDGAGVGLLLIVPLMATHCSASEVTVKVGVNAINKHGLSIGMFGFAGRNENGRGSDFCRFRYANAEGSLDGNLDGIA
jgi:hypothetical protein